MVSTDKVAVTCILYEMSFSNTAVMARKTAIRLSFARQFIEFHATRWTDLMLISLLQRWKLCNQTDWNAPWIVGSSRRSFSLVTAQWIAAVQTELRRHFLVAKNELGQKTE